MGSLESQISIIQNLLDTFLFVFLFLGVGEFVEYLGGFFLFSLGEQLTWFGVVAHKWMKICLGWLVRRLERPCNPGDELGLETAEFISKKNFSFDHPGHKWVSWPLVEFHTCIFEAFLDPFEHIQFIQDRILNSDKLLVGVVVVIVPLLIGFVCRFFWLRLFRLSFILIFSIRWGCWGKVPREVGWGEGSSILKLWNVG